VPAVPPQPQRRAPGSSACGAKFTVYTAIFSVLGATFSVLGAIFSVLGAIFSVLGAIFGFLGAIFGNFTVEIGTFEAESAEQKGTVGARNCVVEAVDRKNGRQNRPFGTVFFLLATEKKKKK
jgi:hypothetical protein